MISKTELARWVSDARARTLELIADLDDDQLMGPHLAIINPLLWEIGHVTWFQEKWALRHAAGQPSLLQYADALYDSAAVAHDTRWSLPLPPRRKTIAYLTDVRDKVLELLADDACQPTQVYFVMLSVFHEDMHTEAFTYLRQTLSIPPPRLEVPQFLPAQGGSLPGDAVIPGGRFLVGAMPDEQFVFDNEKWAHAVEIQPFAIAKAPVTQAEFQAFVDNGGYEKEQFWSQAGWQWLAHAEPKHPVYWRSEGTDRWERRHFDRWAPLEPDLPVIHVNWFEADAYCRWAKRRLPTEAEWEMAAALGAKHNSPEKEHKRRFPWGDEPPTPERANLDWRAMGCVAVGSLPAGASSHGCHHLIGNVWEWTQSDFRPYPGFEIDPYKEYSAPWFGTHKVLRGGCWVTRGRLLRNTWRNFYTPDRRDVWAGLRTCALT
jgi:iron(II)-dependent oxidoreductase